MANYPQRKKKPEPETLGSADDGSSYVAKQKEYIAQKLNEASHSTAHKADVAREKRQQEKLMLKKGGKVKKYAEGGKTDFPDQSAEARKKRLEMPADEYGKMVDKTMGVSKGGKKGDFNEEPDTAPKKTKKYAKGGSIDGCAIRGKTRASHK